MPLHKDLTGADLHEPKGADAASANTVYIADGAGSGGWLKVPATALDTSVLNLNKFYVTVKVADLANVSSVTVPIPFNCTLTRATSCITAAISGADAVITLSRAGAATIGTITIDDAGSGEGILDTCTTPANNTFTAPSFIKLVCDGGPSGGTSDAYVLLEFTMN